MEPITYVTSLLTFYLKGEIRQEANFLKLKIPNTILKFIPLGAKTLSIPVNQLASVETNFKVSIFPLLIGAFITFMGFSLVSDSVVLGLITAIIGANMVISSFQTVMTIKTTDSAERAIHFFIFDKPKAEYAARVILQYISNRMDDTNVRIQNTALGDKIVGAMSSKNDGGEQ